MNAEEIVQQHKSGKLAYHVGLDKLVELGMIQIEAHELLFPEISEDDFQIDLPFDPSDIMQIKLIEKKGDEEE
tara:strand:+ start:305 stop:523 length:219 start_codon:yes stop_codon:yes gene_type:complete